MPNRKLTLRLKPRMDALPELLDKVEAYTEALDIPQEAAYRLAVVCEELITNVAMHGAAGEGGATCIDVSLDRGAGHLQVCIKDDGRAFNPLAEPAPDTGLDLDKRDVGGLGIHFVRRMVKSIAYKRINNRNCLTAVIEAAD